MNIIEEMVAMHRTDPETGIYSVCSAHPMVLEAALRRARRDGTVALIEATSNQVNQEGGYTGLQPADFMMRVLRLAQDVGLPAERVVLGGDHLGPNCWQQLDAEAAMARSEVLIESYVAAGFRKIHLDCSMACGGDPVGLPDEWIAARAARLCAVAERTWNRDGGEAPVYIIGTEVPVPGGAAEAINELEVTSAESATATLAAHREEFERRGLLPAWDRVVGLVVQPGVEFDHERVVDYAPTSARDLSLSIEGGKIVFEAHSTDYQTQQNLACLVRDHFAILKVGPALTYALREALWALDRIEAELFGAGDRVCLRGTVLAAMEQEPRYWRSYYRAEGCEKRLQMEYSLSDRIRYYWPEDRVRTAVDQLLNKLGGAPVPLTLIKQYLPNQYAAIRDGTLTDEPRELVIHKIDEVLSAYAQASGQSGKVQG